MPNNAFGDFQTPQPLASEIVALFSSRQWSRVLEPTCGTGNFIRAANALLNAPETLGIEVDAGYAQEAQKSEATIIETDIFAIDLGRELPWTTAGSLLVVGNPPWVTNAQLTRLDSDNRPRRRNLKGLSGLAAMTGASNFDIAEYIWLKLITELQNERPTISLLCKTQVARNVLEYCSRADLPIASASLHLVDAKKWFNAMVDACLFTVEVGDHRRRGGQPEVYPLYSSIGASTPACRLGVAGGCLVADIDVYQGGQRIDGRCPVEWRQGMKHDAAAVMELLDCEGPVTRAGEAVDVEEDHVYPLLKGTDVFHDRTTHHGRWVLVPQRALGEDTSRLAHLAPKLWRYLNSHADALDRRKSSIYRNTPRFGVFGIGAYSFTPYKVAVSGLHKTAEFRLVGPIGAKPVFFDDTCYILPFQDAIEAAVVVALLRTELVQDFFHAYAFWDAKRPITKKLLQRIDLLAVSRLVVQDELISTAQKHLTRLHLFPSDEVVLAAFSRLTRRWAGPEDALF